MPIKATGIIQHDPRDIAKLPAFPASAKQVVPTAAADQPTPFNRSACHSMCPAMNVWMKK